MASEAIVIPIIVDPKAGVAGLKAVGEQAERTNKQIENGATGASKFGDSMRRMGSNLLQAVGIMKIADVATKAMIQSMIDWVSGAYKMLDARKVLNKAQEEAVTSTREEVVRLQSLVSVAKDASLSYNQRQGAIEKILKMYPELQNQLTLEKINTEGVAQAINKVIDSLIRKSEADLLVKQIAELQNSLIGLNKMDKDLGGGIFSIGGKQIQKGIENTKALIAELRAELVKLMGSNSSSSFGKLFGEAGADVKEVKVKPKKVILSKPGTVELSESIGVFDFDLDQLLFTKNFKFKKPKFSEFIDNDTADNQGLTDGFDQWMEDMQRLQELNEQLASEVSGLLTPAFTGMFDAILSNQDPLRAFFSSIGDMVKQLIAKLIAAAVYAGALSLISGGGTSFAQGFKKFFGFASGGLVTGPVSALVGEGHGTSRSNPEVIAPLDRLQNFFRNIGGPVGGFRTSNMGLAGAIISAPDEIRLRAQGRDMVGTMTLEQLTQGRTTR